MIYCKKDNTAPTGFTITVEGDTSEVLQELARVGSEIYNAALVGLGKVETSIDETYEYCELTPGDHFYYNDYEYVLLDVFESGEYLAITADIADVRQFHGNSKDGCNNWANSHLRCYLNDEYMDVMGIEPKHLFKYISDLTADNGDKSYGKCEDYIFLLSCELYRKYRELIPKYNDYIWTLTPWSCDTGCASTVRSVHPSGTIYYDYATYSNGVAPACIFNHEILIPRRQAQTGRIILDEATGDDDGEG